VRAPRVAIAAVALGAVALELAVSGRYGYVRDELYFLAAGQHLAFGYVDQPALTPVLARVSAVLGGNSLVGLRVLPALALGAIVMLTAAMSRLLGAGRIGQMLAALAAATCGEYLAAAHELTTTTPDFLFWTVTLYLVTRLLASRDARWWLAIGGCVGVASEAKWNIGFLAVALLAGFLLTGARPLLRSRHLAVGGVIAAVLAAPDLIWQTVHGWPNMAVFSVLQMQAGHNRATYWLAQIIFTGLALTPIWVAGLYWSLRSAQARPFRAVGIGCALVVLLQFVLGGKPYYPGAAYTFLLAAGCVPVERWLSARRPLLGRIRSAAAMRAACSYRRLWCSRWRCQCCPLRCCAPFRSRRSTTTWLSRLPGRSRSPSWRASMTGCQPRSDGARRSSPATTARLARSNATGPSTDCRSPTAAPTTSGCGARRQRRTRPPSP